MSTNILGQQPPGQGGTVGHLSVANAFKSVQPMGHPMSHSTQFGFSCPLFEVSVPLPSKTALDRWSLALLFPSFLIKDSVLYPPLQSREHGVGQVLRPTTVSRFARRAGLCADSGVIVAAIALKLRGVGHNPDPFPLVRGGNVMRSHNSPPCIKPHFGKVTEDGSKSSAHSKHWTILDEHPFSRTHFIDNSRHVLPHTGSLSVNPCSFSGGADVLAGKASRYDINTASPRSSVKGLNVVPDRERRQRAIVLSVHQDGSCVGVPFHSADGPPSKEMSSENSSTSACEKSQLMHLAPFRSGRPALPRFLMASDK